MNVPAPITRRQFASATLGFVGFSLFLRPLGLRYGSTSSDSYRALGHRIAGLMAHRESAHFVGSEYMRIVPRERSVKELVDLITSTLSDNRYALYSSTDAELRRLLAHRIRRDFEEDRTVAIDGWIMSATEARLCAVAALI